MRLSAAVICPTSVLKRLSADDLLAQPQREGVDRPVARVDRARCEPGPTVDCVTEIGVDDRLAAVVAVVARTLVGLHLEQLEHLRALVRGGHHPQLTAVVGEQQPGRAHLEELGGEGREHPQELDQVEVVDEGVCDLDERLGEQFRCDHRDFPLSCTDEPSPITSPPR